MLVRKTKIQLVAFLVVSVLAVAYALVRFTDVEKTFGAGGYTVHLHLTSSGGIFTGAEVTYRGYNIGEVGRLSLTDVGLAAEVLIEPDTHREPRELDVHTANRPSVGDPYVDLRPSNAHRPLLVACS